MPQRAFLWAMRSFVPHEDRVVSVPHSGTRSLRAYLGHRTHYHFRGSEQMLKRCRTVHIPIRHPMDVAESWACREKTGDVLGAMLESYRIMFDFLNSKRTARARLYRMESLPQLSGMGERSRVAVAKTRAFQREAWEQVVRPNIDFFSRFYPDLEHADT